MVNLLTISCSLTAPRSWHSSQANGRPQHAYLSHLKLSLSWLQAPFIGNYLSSCNWKSLTKGLKFLIPLYVTFIFAKHWWQLSCKRSPGKYSLGLIISASQLQPIFHPSPPMSMSLPLANDMRLISCPLLWMTSRYHTMRRQSLHFLHLSLSHNLSSFFSSASNKNINILEQWH